MFMEKGLCDIPEDTIYIQRQQASTIFENRPTSTHTHTIYRELIVLFSLYYFVINTY